MSADLLTIPAQRLRRSTDLIVRRTASALDAVQQGCVTMNRCKGCNRPVGYLPDYCAECTQEDETDCW
jgi:hypothetical protein